MARKSPRSRASEPNSSFFHAEQQNLGSTVLTVLTQGIFSCFLPYQFQLKLTLIIRDVRVSLCLIDLVQPVRISRRSTRLFLSQLVSQFCCGDKSCTLQENKFLLLVHTRYRNQPNSLRKLNEENKLRAKRSLNKDQIPCTS